MIYSRFELVLDSLAGLESCVFAAGAVACAGFGEVTVVLDAVGIARYIAYQPLFKQALGRLAFRAQPAPPATKSDETCSLQPMRVSSRASPMSVWIARYRSGCAITTS